MCFTINTLSEVKIAEEDIKCQKLLIKTKEGQYFAPFITGYEYEVGKTYEAKDPMSLERINGLIDELKRHEKEGAKSPSLPLGKEGIHAYMSMSHGASVEILEAMQILIGHEIGWVWCEFIIPKGTWFIHKANHSVSGHYLIFETIAPKMKFSKQISEV